MNMITKCMCILQMLLARSLPWSSGHIQLNASKIIHIHAGWSSISSVEFVACFLVVNSLAWENKSHGKIINKIIFLFKE